MTKKKEAYKPLPEYLSIGPSDIHGAGIFATDDIPKEINIGMTDDQYFMILQEDEMHLIIKQHFKIPSTKELSHHDFSRFVERLERWVVKEFNIKL